MQSMRRYESVGLLLFIFVFGVSHKAGSFLDKTYVMY